MNKTNKTDKPNSVDGLHRANRRSLRDKRPLQSRNNLETVSNSTQRSNLQTDLKANRVSDSQAQMSKSKDSSTKQEKSSPRKGRGAHLNRKPKKFAWLRTLRPSRSNLKRLGAVFGVVVIGMGAFFGWKIWNAANAVIVERGDSAIGLNREIQPEDLTEEGSARINILLIGVPGKAGYDGRLLNDVTMVLSIDPASEDASLLSIPRDLVVDIEDYGLNKINAAHSYGAQDSTTTGPKLLEQTVEEVLDININYFARIDFDGFVDTVDVLGGVTVDVKEPLYDASIDSRYGQGGVFSLPAGEQTLDGLQALQYVRCRKGTCGNDFGRAERQQQILSVIRDKVINVGTFTNPKRISQLLDQLSQHFRTDISISEGLQLYDITKSYNSPRSFVLNTNVDNYLGTSSVIGGGLAPKSGHLNFTEIQRFVRGDLFRDGFLKRENAPITILNGTTMPSLASELELRLDGLGYNPVEADNAPDQTIEKTVIYQRQDTESEFTHHLLSKRMGLEVKQGIPAEYKQFKGDYIIIIGADYDEV